MDIRAVNQITEILREHGGTLVNEEWQTLKAAVLAQQTNNKPNLPCEHRYDTFNLPRRCTFCGEWEPI